MNKIPTIFDRDWDGNRGVIDKFAIDPDILKVAIPTEKVDGTNVRITVRNNEIVRLEKRRNPTKLEKAKGIVDPWYVDADPNDPQDKYIYDAIRRYKVSFSDGEYSAEAYGEKIQGGSLNTPGHSLYIFSIKPRVLLNVPTDFEALKEWLKTAKSCIGNDCGIEGIVWHKDGVPVAKIKLKDFK